MRAGLPALGGRSPPVAKRYGCSGGSRHTLAADPRSAVLAKHGRPSRLRTTAVFHASRTPARTLAHTLLTIERTCPAGASWSLPLGRLMHLDASHPSTRAGFSNASPFAISNFVRALVQHRGQLPPARRARGGISGLLARRRRSVLRHPKENKRATFQKNGGNPILARLCGRFDGVPYVHPRSEHICSP